MEINVLFLNQASCKDFILLNIVLCTDFIVHVDDVTITIA